MKILKTTDIRKVDEYTIAHEPIASIDLMERAAKTVFRWFIDKYTTKQPITIFCGNGNNGGDGLALARLLILADYHVDVYILQSPEHFSPDAQINYERLKWLNKNKIEFLSNNLPNIPSNTLIIDALFGTGLNRSLEGYNAALVQHINQSNCTIISIDIPSGLFGENNANNNRDAIIQATYTLTFEIPKLAFFFPENEKQTGEWHILPIGLHANALKDFNTDFYFTTTPDIAKYILPRNKFAHKGTFGKALLIAGSYGMMGAAVLAAKACYRAGAGRLTTHVPRCGVAIMQTSVAESLLSIDEDENHFSSLPVNLDSYNTVGIGCGIGQLVSTQNILDTLLEQTEKPMVLDADALNILAKQNSLLQLIPKNSIITPHPAEFERFVGKWQNDYERLMLQIDFAAKYNLIVVLKGAHTSIALPNGKVYFNSTGNAGMATAGSGDVLTGIIIGLLAQHYTPEIAARLGVFIHGLAGDMAKDDWGEEGLIASDIIQYIGKAIKHLHNLQAK